MAEHPDDKPIPQQITVHTQSHQLEITFSDARTFFLPFEYLRVFSPSAEVRGHGEGQAILQSGKRNIDIARIESVGQYAIKPIFSDGHDSGIYTWDYLYQLGHEQSSRWQHYLEQLNNAGASRDVDTTSAPPHGKSCASK